MDRPIFSSFLLVLFFAGLVRSQLNPSSFDQQYYQDALDEELCAEQLAFLTNDNLGFEFVDASGTIPSGITTGNFNDLGDYHQCIGINHVDQEMEIQGKYCMIVIPLNQEWPSWPQWNVTLPEIPGNITWPLLSETDAETIRWIRRFEGMKKASQTHARFMSKDTRQPNSRVFPTFENAAIGMTIAMCVPRVCSPAQAIETFQAYLPLNLTTLEYFCRMPGDKPFVTVDYIAIVIFSLIGLLNVMCTTFDLVHKYYFKRDAKDTSALLRSFSLYTNTRRLLTFNPVAGSLDSVDGIRAISMMWIVLGHSFSFTLLTYVHNSMFILNWMTSFNSTLITAAPITVDTFFMLSGLLVVYTVIGKIGREMGWGVRHIQMACMCMCITGLFIVRCSMGVAILSMTDLDHRNGSITVYDWDKTTQGYILSSFFWGYMMMQVPAGMLSKRFGGKPVLLFALLANAALSLLVPLFASLGGWQLVCACRWMTGLAQSFTFPASHTLLGRWLPSNERVLLSGIVYGGTQLGTILGMPISGYLASTSLGWPLVFYAMAGLMLLTAAIWYWMTASSPSEHRLMTEEEKEYIELHLNLVQGEKRMRTPWRHIVTSRQMWAIAAAHIGAAYGFIMFFVDMPTYLEKGLGLSLRNSASLSALPYIGMWAGSMVATSLSQKITNMGLISTTTSRKLFNTIGALGLSSGLIGMAYGTKSSAGAIAWMVGALTVNGFYASGFLVNHLDLSPNLAGLLLSLTNFIGSGICVCTPLITSFLLNNDATDLSRWRIVFLVTAGISLTTNAIYVLFGSSKLQPWDDPNFLEKDAHQEELKPVLNQEEKKEFKTT